MIYIYLYNAIQVVVFSFGIQWCCHCLQVFHTGDLWWARQSNVVGHIANQIFNAEATLTYFDNAGGHVHRWLLTMEDNAGSSPLRSQIISWKGLKLSLNLNIFLDANTPEDYIHVTSCWFTSKQQRWYVFWHGTTAMQTCMQLKGKAQKWVNSVQKGTSRMGKHHGSEDGKASELRPKTP